MIKCEVKKDEAEIKKTTKVVMTKQTDIKYFDHTVISITDKGICISVFPKNCRHDKDFYGLLASLFLFEDCAYGTEKTLGDTFHGCRVEC